MREYICCDRSLTDGVCAVKQKKLERRPSGGVAGSKKNSSIGTRTRVCRVRGDCYNHLNHTGTIVVVDLRKKAISCYLKVGLCVSEFANISQIYFLSSLELRARCGLAPPVSTRRRELMAASHGFGFMSYPRGLFCKSFFPAFSYVSATTEPSPSSRERFGPGSEVPKRTGNDCKMAEGGRT